MRQLNDTNKCDVCGNQIGPVPKYKTIWVYRLGRRHVVNDKDLSLDEAQRQVKDDQQNGNSNIKMLIYTKM